MNAFCPNGWLLATNTQTLKNQQPQNPATLASARRLANTQPASAGNPLLPPELATSRLAPSPNYDDRPDNTHVSLLVIHNISLPPGQFGGPYIEDLFLNRLDYPAHPWLEQLRGLRVSAHFLIRRCGAIIQFVATHKRAWHAGVSVFEGRERCNDFSIGIELEGADHTFYTDRQYQTLAALTRQLRANHPLQAVRGHEHIAPGRKTDPGPGFNWQRYAREAGWQQNQLPPACRHTGNGAQHPFVTPIKQAPR